MSLATISSATSRSASYGDLQPLADGRSSSWHRYLAEVNRAPFDMPEAEQELTAGYHTEYSGMKFALFFMAEYIKMIAVSASLPRCSWAATGPGVDADALAGTGLPVAQGHLAALGMIWMRATMPRFRYDRLMAFGWKILLPAPCSTSC
jgi:NADH-quinone oxidoreductase subunit H